MLMKAVMPKKFQLNVIPDFRTFLFPDGGEIHYIGGSDILPAPLEAEQSVIWEVHMTKRRGNF